MAAGKGRVTTDMGYKTGAIVTTAIAAAFVALASVCISIELLGHTPTAVAIGLLAASLPAAYIAWRVRIDVGEIERAEERNRRTAMGECVSRGHARLAADVCACSVDRGFHIYNFARHAIL